MKRTYFQVPVIATMMLASLFLLLGCSTGTSPEDRVRSFLDEAERAVEENDLRTLREMISPSYSDTAGRGKTDIANYLAYRVLQQKSIHLFVSVDTLHFPQPDTAEVSLFAAMTGTPVESSHALFDIQADMYRFDITLHETAEGFEVIGASWRPALLDDLVEK